MGYKSLELYIDESGNFEDQSREKISKGYAPSLVGGLLCPTSAITPALLRKVPEYLHANEGYHKDIYFPLLSEMKNVGGEFIIFENTERLRIVNGDTTYLNIISEGIVKLLQRLAIDYPDDEIQLNILIAVRWDVKQTYETNSVILIPESEYLQRLEEKLILSMGRQQIGGVKTNIRLGSARKEKRLMMADLICNTYLTQNAPHRFTDEDRIFIKSLYNEDYIFPVFENATAGYINRLYIDGRYEEMLFQLCALKSISNVNRLKNKLVTRINTLSYNEQKSLFSYMSLQIRQFNNRRQFVAGICFAENYKKYFLEALEKGAGKYSSLGQELAYWSFDTDFYILTMYDHLGNAGKCNEYLQLCQANIHAVCSSWEHIDYYFQFKIRELNCLLGQFRFEEVIKKADQFISVLTDAKDVFGMIGTYEDMELDTSSELLGKVNGVKLEAIINLLHGKPELFDSAVETSDAAIDEFLRPQDLQRQWQYRSMLMVEVRKPDQAIDCLLRSFDISQNDENAFEQFLDKTLNVPRIEVFSLFHYTNVLYLLYREKNSEANRMGNALFKNKKFQEMLSYGKVSGHPWNLILWNISRISRIQKQQGLADSLFKRALTLTVDNPDNLTMYTYALSMLAERILQLKRDEKDINSELKEYARIYSKFLRPSTPESFKKQFPAGTDESVLKLIADNYLR